MKREQRRTPAATDALEVLAAQIAIARRELGWTTSQLADRIGVTPALISRIERAAPGTAIGSVFEAALACGVPLFGREAADLRGLALSQRDYLALLPQRVHFTPPEISDDF